MSNKKVKLNLEKLECLQNDSKMITKQNFINFFEDFLQEKLEEIWNFEKKESNIEKIYKKLKNQLINYILINIL